MACSAVPAKFKGLARRPEFVSRFDPRRHGWGRVVVAEDPKKRTGKAFGHSNRRNRLPTVQMPLVVHDHVAAPASTAASIFVNVQAAR